MQIGFVVKFTLGNQDGLQEFEAARPFDRLWGQGLSHQQRHSADKIAPRNGVIFQAFSLKNLFPDHFCSWFGKMNYICAQIHYEECQRLFFWTTSQNKKETMCLPEDLQEGIMNMVGKGMDKELDLYWDLVNHYLKEHSSDIMGFLINKAEREDWSTVDLGMGMVEVFQAAVAEIKKYGPVKVKHLEAIYDDEEEEDDDDGDYDSYA